MTAERIRNAASRKGKRRREHRAEGIGEDEEKRIAQSAKRIAERYKEEYELQEEGEKSIAN